MFKENKRFLSSSVICSRWLGVGKIKCCPNCISSNFSIVLRTLYAPLILQGLAINSVVIGYIFVPVLYFFTVYASK